MGLSAFNAMRARLKAKEEADKIAKVNVLANSVNEVVEDKVEEVKAESTLSSKKKTDAEKLKKKKVDEE